jgi:hypothetical protein
MRLEGLGQSSSPSSIVNANCGDNPCTWLDDVWVSDACLAFLECAQPTNILVTSMTQGTGAAVGQAAGSVAASTVGGVASGIANVAGTNGTLIIVAAAALLLVVAMKK